jgi:TIR domain
MAGRCDVGPGFRRLSSSTGPPLVVYCNWEATRGAMPNRIFISYRRDDASGQAGRLYDQLVERFGENSVFMDVDTIPPGEEFDRYIDDILRDCYMCIVVIGQRWSIERLHADGDFVRREIAIAFARKVRVIPALFDGAKLPEAEKLPAEITDLARCEAYDFGAGRTFKRQVTELLAQVDRAIEEAKQRKRERNREALRGIALRPHQYPIWVLFICALIALAVFASLTWVPTQVRALASLWKAEAAQSKGDNLMAISQFRSVLSQFPTSRDAKINLATALFSSKSDKAAQEAMNLLLDMKLYNFEWDQLKKVMPAEYQALFEDEKKP